MWFKYVYNPASLVCACKYHEDHATRSDVVYNSTYLFALVHE